MVIEVIVVSLILKPVGPILGVSVKIGGKIGGGGKLGGGIAVFASESKNMDQNMKVCSYR